MSIVWGELAGKWERPSRDASKSGCSVVSPLSIQDALSKALKYLVPAEDTRPDMTDATGPATKTIYVTLTGLPLDIRVLLSGYLPNYAYDLGATDTSLSFERLREIAKIHDRAVQADTDPLFSARIREGIPAPR